MPGRMHEHTITLGLPLKSAHTYAVSARRGSSLWPWFDCQVSNPRGFFPCHDIHASVCSRKKKQVFTSRWHWRTNFLSSSSRIFIAGRQAATKFIGRSGERSVRCQYTRNDCAASCPGSRPKRNEHVHARWIDRFNKNRTIDSHPGAL